MKEGRQGRGCRRLTRQISCECVWQILTFWLLLYRPPFIDEGQISCAKADRTFTFTRQISSECVHCVGFRCQNNNFGQIITFGGTVPTPFYRWEPNLVCYSWPTVHVYTSKFVFIGLFYRPMAAKNPHFLPFFGLRHLLMSTVGGNLSKLNTGAQLQTFRYPTASNHFCIPTPSWLNRANKLWRSKAWRTDKKLVFRRLGGGWNPSHTKLSMVIEDLEHVLASSKRFRVWLIVSPLGGTKHLGVTRLHQILNFEEGHLGITEIW